MVTRKGHSRAALLLALSLCPQVASAAPPDAGDPVNDTVETDDARARAAFAEGLEALYAGNWTLAEGHFRRSLELVARPSTRYNLAFVLFRQDRLQESLAVLDDLRLSIASGADPEYREYAEALAARIRVRLEAQPQPVAGKSDPAPLPAVAGASRSKPLSHPVSTSRASPKPAPVDRDLGLSSWGPWVSVGIGSALLVVGTITGLAARRADQRFVDGCPDIKDCDPSLNKHKDDAIRLGRITDVLWISGATFVVGGVVWRVVTPARPQQNGVRTEPVMVTVTARY